MIFKFTLGKPIQTDATVLDIKDSNLSDFTQKPKDLTIDTSNNLNITYTMDKKDIVYGLGQSIRGLNKRGHLFISNCSDDPCHTEEKNSLYGAHNFIILNGHEKFALFVDTAAVVKFDIGCTDYDTINITCEDDCTLYVLTGDNVPAIVREFRTLIGKSYIPPYWAFGYQQSRWSYNTADDVRRVVKNHRDNNLPLDAVYLDIDYMDNFKDFTINEAAFPNFEEFVNEMKEQSIHLVPIIDAGVKEETGYDVYDEGVANNYFCKKADKTNFKAAVWPGMVSFPDFFKEDTRTWFGNKYKFLLDKGIDGFWNDMNEPAIFFSPEKLEEAIDFAISCKDKNINVYEYFDLKDHFTGISNARDDYAKIYHEIDGQKVNHLRVHNLYGARMTKAASESFERNVPDKRILMFSRSSHIGTHRYSGIWTGDNQSWWSHILLNIKMMPSLNMCGYLYTGADLGGFGCNATKDLVLRWLAFGIFTPLMRNHSALGTRNQEAYSFGDCSEFRNIINLRYQLIPHLYSEFVKAAINDDMYFKPLSFEFAGDEIASRVEDQLLIGDSLMIAPIYNQNEVGRVVYLPETMLYLLKTSDGSFKTKVMEKGHHYINVELDEVPMFIRKNTLIPLVKPAQNTNDINTKKITMFGFVDKATTVEYTLYEDDHISKIDYSNALENVTTFCYKSNMDASSSSEISSNDKKVDWNITLSE